MGKVQTLEFSGMGFDDDAIIRLAELVTKCKSLTSLNVSYNPKITDEGAARLDEKLPEALTELRLMGTQTSFNLEDKGRFDEEKNEIIHKRIGMMKKNAVNRAEVDFIRNYYVCLEEHARTMAEEAAAEEERLRVQAEEAEEKRREAAEKRRKR